jgi:nicotinamide-nucleotide amidase
MIAVFPSELMQTAEKLLDLCRMHGLSIATAESCTGGLLAALLTEIPGSSRVFERGFVTYSDHAKVELLGVSSDFINRHGAVSAEVALGMAKGALKHSRASIAVSITGVAGPGGGTTAKPVGLVFLACIRDGRDASYSRLELGTRPRNAIREASVEEAMRLLCLAAER